MQYWPQERHLGTSTPQDGRRNRRWGLPAEALAGQKTFLRPAAVGAAPHPHVCRCLPPAEFLSISKTEACALRRPPSRKRRPGESVVIAQHMHTHLSLSLFSSLRPLCVRGFFQRDFGVLAHRLVKNIVPYVASQLETFLDPCLRATDGTDRWFLRASCHRGDRR